MSQIRGARAVASDAVTDPRDPDASPTPDDPGWVDDVLARAMARAKAAASEPAAAPAAEPPAPGPGFDPAPRPVEPAPGRVESMGDPTAAPRAVESMGDPTAAPRPVEAAPGRFESMGDPTAAPGRFGPPGEPGSSAPAAPGRFADPGPVGDAGYTSARVVTRDELDGRDPATAVATLDPADDGDVAEVPAPVDDGAEPDRNRQLRTLIEWSAVIVGALVVALLIKTFLFQAYYIPSQSMEPTLQEGDRILVNKLSYRLHDVNRGDLVVFNRPDNLETEIPDLIKRVVALGARPSRSTTGGSTSTTGCCASRTWTRRCAPTGSATDPPTAPTRPRRPTAAWSRRGTSS